MPAKISANGLRVLEARYLRRDNQGRVIETPEQLFERVAHSIAQGELLYAGLPEAKFWEERFYQMLAGLDFLPNSPTLMNAGTPLGQLAACFVLPVEDTMESIFGTLRDAALIQRTGGGTGFSFSRLRPAGDHIASTGGTSSGPISFMKIYDCATENVKLGGRRRGANMGVLRVDHPDIEEFINAKRDGVSLQNFNLSVGVTDDFLQAADAGKEFVLRHPVTGSMVRRVSAGKLFDTLCEAAWATGDPGLLYLDTIARTNPLPTCGPLECTNPCGELPLLPYESCNLGSINLVHFVTESERTSTIDWDRLRMQVCDGVRFLDDVISVNRLPLETVAQATLASRKIGLGILGFAELCILLGISYASNTAIELADQLMAFIQQEARQASAKLAEERGVFPHWAKSTFAAVGLRLRHATQTSIAPTGTISILAGTSSGIEPLFALAYRRQNVLGEQTLSEFNPLVLRHLKRLGLDTPMVLDSIASSGRLGGSIAGDEAIQKLFVTALEIPPEHHVRVQAAFQKHVDNAVSKTVNLPSEASPSDVAGVYRLAYQLGCKGVTVFRYGSKSEQMLRLGVGEAAEEREYFTKCDPGACRL